MVAWMPTARPRCSGGKMDVRIAARFATIIDAPTAWTAREATRTGVPGARPPIAELVTKTASPARYTRLWPHISPSRPKVSSSALDQQVDRDHPLDGGQ